jgi:hypothetical protein
MLMSRAWWSWSVEKAVVDAVARWLKTVIPAKAGIQLTAADLVQALDPRFREDDGNLAGGM